jgi:hypothetical protein
MPRSYVLCRIGRLVRELRLGRVVDAVVARAVRVVYDLVQVDGSWDVLRERITRVSVLRTMSVRAAQALPRDDPVWSLVSSQRLYSRLLRFMQCLRT